MESLLFDVRNQFLKDGRFFPEEAEETIRYNFQFRDEYAEMQTREEEKKEIANLIGSGEIMEGMTDEIVESFNRPEIMGVDISEYSTTREEVVPPEIQKFYSSDRTTFFGRIASGFKRLFRR